MFSKTYQNIKYEDIINDPLYYYNELIKYKVLVFKKTMFSSKNFLDAVQTIYPNANYIKYRENVDYSDLFNFYSDFDKDDPKTNEYFCKWGEDNWLVNGMWFEEPVDISATHIQKLNCKSITKFVDLEKVFLCLEPDLIDFAIEQNPPSWNQELDLPPSLRHTVLSPPIKHRAFRIHPETNRISILYTGPNTIGKNQDKWLEYSVKIKELFEMYSNHIDLQWDEGDIAIWDNRCVAHALMGFKIENRLSNEIEIGKSKPIYFTGDKKIKLPKVLPHKIIGDYFYEGSEDVIHDKKNIKYINIYENFIEKKDLEKIKQFLKTAETKFTSPWEPIDSISINRNEDILAILGKYGEMARLILEKNFNCKIDRSESDKLSSLHEIAKYRTGARVNTHADKVCESWRDLSFILYYNEDFDGGELYFPRFDYSIKPKARNANNFSSRR